MGMSRGSGQQGRKVKKTTIDKVQERSEKEKIFAAVYDFTFTSHSHHLIQLRVVNLVFTLR